MQENTCRILPILARALGLVVFLGLGRLPLGLALQHLLLLFLLRMHQDVDLQRVLERPVLQGSEANGACAPLRDALHPSLGHMREGLSRSEQTTDPNPT